MREYMAQILVYLFKNSGSYNIWAKVFKSSDSGIWQIIINLAPKCCLLVANFYLVIFESGALWYGCVLGG